MGDGEHEYGVEYIGAVFGRSGGAILLGDAGVSPNVQSVASFATGSCEYMSTHCNSVKCDIGRVELILAERESSGGELVEDF